MPLHLPLMLSLTATLRQLGGVGLLLLGVLDSSIIPTFGSLDVLVIVLAARHPDLWLYYAGMSLVGSVIGAYSTYRLGHRMGAQGLKRRLRTAQVDWLNDLFERWGILGVALPALAPPPFPTSVLFLGAGAFSYDLSKYMASVTGARALRYCTVAYLGAHFGRHIATYFRHPSQHVVAYVLTLAAVSIIGVGSSMMWNRLKRSEYAKVDNNAKQEG